MLVSENTLPPMRILKLALPPTRNPKVSQWNIGCVGSQMQNDRVGHLHFLFFCVPFIRVRSRFSVESGEKSLLSILKVNIYFAMSQGHRKDFFKGRWGMQKFLMEISWFRIDYIKKAKLKDICVRSISL